MNRIDESKGAVSAGEPCQQFSEAAQVRQVFAAVHRHRDVRAGWEERQPRLTRYHPHRVDGGVAGDDHVRVAFTLEQQIGFGEWGGG